MNRSSILFMVAMIGTSHMMRAQLLNAYTCGWGANSLTTQVTCPYGCDVAGGGSSSVESYDTSDTPNTNFSGQPLTLACANPSPNPMGLDCQPLYYFKIQEDDQTCGACPDCSNIRCSNYCTGSLVCVSNTCVEDDPPCDDNPPCDNAVCDTSNGTWNTDNCNSGCSTDDDCPGGLVCLSGSCGCSDICDDPSCDSNYNCDCLDECGGGGGCSSDSDCPGGLVCQSGGCVSDDCCETNPCDCNESCGSGSGGGSGGGGGASGGNCGGFYQYCGPGSETMSGVTEGDCCSPLHCDSWNTWECIW